MSAALLATRLALGALLVVAGTAKCLNLGAFRRRLADFGIPAALVAPLGALLPPVEIATGAALWSPAAMWGAAGASGLFAAFSVAIAANLWRGRRPACGCFGQLDTTPIGRATLVRALLLTAVAGVLVWRGPGADLWPTLWGTAQGGGGWMLVVGLCAAALVVQGAMVYMLLRQQGRLLIRVEALEARLKSPAAVAPPSRIAGLPPGAALPEAYVTGQDGTAVSLATLSSGTRALVLVFTDPDCPACASLSEDIDDWRHELGRQARIAVVSAPGASQSSDVEAVYGRELVFTQRAREVSDLFQVVGTPSAVLIRDDGTIGSRLAEGADAIRQLLTSVNMLLASGENPERRSQPVLQ